MRFFNFIASMKAGLILLGLIAIAAAIGSSFWPEMFFQSIYFRILLLLFLINMAFCTFKSLNNFIRRQKKLRHNRRQLIRTVFLIMLHLGIVLIIVGAGLNSWWGHSAQLSIHAAETVEINQIVPTKTPFQLKLLDFRITFNDDGSPAQYYSDLQVACNGQIEPPKTIRVNYPLTFAGVKFYQNSFGYSVNTDIEDGEDNRSRLLDDGNIIDFNASSRTVKFFKYIPNFDPTLGMQTRSLEPKNQRIIYSVYEGSNLLGVGTAPFNERLAIDEQVFITFSQVQPYSILTVKTDPGLPLTASGGILLMLGTSVVLLMPRKKTASLQKTKEETQA